MVEGTGRENKKEKEKKEKEEEEEEEEERNRVIHRTICNLRKQSKFSTGTLIARVEGLRRALRLLHCKLKRKSSTTDHPLVRHRLRLLPSSNDELWKNCSINNC